MAAEPDADLPSVVEAIETRFREGSRPRCRADPWRIALVVEGGGMRGVVAGGIVTAIEALGRLRCFDALYGASAGACACAYLAAGGAALGTRIFFEDINNRRFIDPRRALAGRPVMDLDFLIDHVMATAKPLDWRAVLRSPAEVGFVATDADTGELVLIDRFDSRRTVFEAMRASARIPLLAGPPVAWQGRRLVDGGLASGLPLDPVLASGPTHILAALTRPVEMPPGPSGGATAMLTSALLQWAISPAVAELYLHRNERYCQLVRRICGEEASPTSPPRIKVVAPRREDGTIARLETRSEMLIRGGRAGFQAICSALGAEASPPF